MPEGGQKQKKNGLGMTPIFFESKYPKASKKGRKKYSVFKNLIF